MGTTNTNNITFVTYYRLLTTGTIEEKIFQRQISKTGLSGAVVDPQNQSTIRLSNEELKVHDFPTVESHSLSKSMQQNLLSA